MWVSPFGYLRINGYLLLPEAFRSLSRPSSALSAKASTLRPSCLTFSMSSSLIYGLPSAIALASGFFLMNCFRTPYRLWDAAARFLPSALTDVPPLVFSGLYVTSVTPRMSFLSLCVLRLDIDCCICGFQGTSRKWENRTAGSLLPLPFVFFHFHSVPARERMSSCS